MNINTKEDKKRLKFLIDKPIKNKIKGNKNNCPDIFLQNYPQLTHLTF